MAPIIGAPDAIAKQIQQEFTQRGREAARHRATQPRTSAPTTRCAATSSPPRKRSATKVSYIWDVTDPSGKRVNRITGEEVVPPTPRKDPWAAMTPPVAQSIAGKAANSFVAWLPSQTQQGGACSNVAFQPSVRGAQPAAACASDRRPSSDRRLRSRRHSPTRRRAASASDGPVTAIVPCVTGAPGDGSDVADGRHPARADAQGRAVADADRRTAYRVEGKVTVGEAKDGKQPIQIDWL